METDDGNGTAASPLRLLEMLEGRFGAFEAIAYASLELEAKGPDDCPPMDPMTAEAILEFGDDLRQARKAAHRWASAEGITPRYVRRQK